LDQKGGVSEQKKPLKASIEAICELNHDLLRPRAGDIKRAEEAA
jgi:hypothetical protein